MFVAARLLTLSCGVSVAGQFDSDEDEDEQRRFPRRRRRRHGAAAARGGDGAEMTVRPQATTKYDARVQMVIRTQFDPRGCSTDDAFSNLCTHSPHYGEFPCYCQCTIYRTIVIKIVA